MTLNISSPLFLFSSLSELWARRDWAQPRNRNLNPAPSRPNHNYAFAFPLLSQDRNMIKRSLAVSKIGFCCRLESFQQQDHKNPPPPPSPLPRLCPFKYLFLHIKKASLCSNSKKLSGSNRNNRYYVDISYFYPLF